MTDQVTNVVDSMKDAVRLRYGAIAQGVAATDGLTRGCCGPFLAPSQGVAGVDVLPLIAGSTGCCAPAAEPTGARRLYGDEELTGLPAAATAAALGCGSPTAIAALQPGQVVLDLGCGGGIDCFLAARQVGPTGQVIGLDMTPTMIELAERNKAALGAAAANVTFQLGEIEAMPLPDASVDVIISNCVINLSPDKDAVLREAYRVLRPGGRLVVSDTVALQPFSPALTASMAAWSACVAGALDVQTYMAKLQAAGFTDVVISGLTPTDFGLGVDAVDGLQGGDLKQWLASALITARKEP